MIRGDTPCSALTFVKNSAASLEECLKSTLWCGEHVLLDGGSTDGTLALAEKYSCKVVPQHSAFLNSEGRIIDYAGITNQGIREARFPWIAIVDSDEFIDGQLTAEMKRMITLGVPAACYVERLYTFHGHIIRAASTYPNRQIRLFHKEAITEFVKIVHERPELKKGIVPTVLPGIQYVPLDPIPDLVRKYRRYLDLETQFAGGHGWVKWFRLLTNKLLRMDLRLFRIIRQRLTYKGRDCLPLSYEYLHFWYPWQIVIRTFPPVYRRRKKRP